MSVFQIYQTQDNLEEIFTIQLYSEFQPIFVKVIDDNGVERKMIATDKIEAPSADMGLSVWEKGITVASYIDMYSFDENEQYHRPLDSILIGFGGKLVDSSNWISKENQSQKTSGVSFSPTEVWIFPDNSLLEINASTTRIIKD